MALPPLPSRLRLLVCRLGELRLAVDADRVRRIEPRDPDLRLPWFDELVPCRTSRGAGPAHAVALKDARAVPGFLVSELEDVVTVAASDLRPLPALVSRFAARYGLRGVALLERCPAFVFDVAALPAPPGRREESEGGPP